MNFSVAQYNTTVVFWWAVALFQMTNSNIWMSDEYWTCNIRSSSHIRRYSHKYILGIESYTKSFSYNFIMQWYAIITSNWYSVLHFPLQCKVCTQCTVSQVCEWRFNTHLFPTLLVQLHSQLVNRFRFALFIASPNASYFMLFICYYYSFGRLVFHFYAITIANSSIYVSLVFLALPRHTSTSILSQPQMYQRNIVITLLIIYCHVPHGLAINRYHTWYAPLCCRKSGKASTTKAHALTRAWLAMS